MGRSPYPDLDQNTLYYTLAKLVCRGFFKLFSRFQVVGREKLVSQGPLIIASNHLHALDPPAIFAILPYRTTVLAASKYEHTWQGSLLRPLGPIFIRRGEIDRVALRKCLHVLEGGGLLGMSPEGTRSDTGGLQEARRGVAYLAYRTGARIQPVALHGIEKIIQSLRKGQRARVVITVGDAFELPPVEGRPRAEELAAATDLIMNRLAALLPASYRGIYG